ncbi:MAG: hypothetical protein HKN33_04800 [Pyrinomonadaceae bacterium]|nr:hypothetical protein [Pyrinomonadaceae bacterium]
MKHSTVRNGKRLIWKTERLWDLARDLEPFEVEVESFRELDQDCWFGSHKVPSLRNVAEHCRRINTADFSKPIILNEDGSLMDGGHRLCRALLEGQKHVMAVRFEKMPAPDKIEKPPDCAGGSDK